MDVGDQPSAKVGTRLSIVTKKGKKAPGAQEEETVEEKIQRMIDEKVRSMKRIETQLTSKVWVWDRDIGHKLFNFHEGYETLPNFPPLIGSRKYNIMTTFVQIRCLTLYS